MPHVCSKINGLKIWADIFPKKAYIWPISTQKRCSTSLIIRKMQTKTQWDFTSYLLQRILYKKKKDIPCSWIRRINKSKWLLLSKEIYRFNAILITLSMTFFIEQEQKIFKFVWEHKRPQRAKAILWKKTGAGGIRFPDLTATNI